MGRIFFGLLLLLSFLIFPGNVSAEDFVIQSFHSDIRIQKSGEVRVTERIIVDFAQNEKHGIYRDLPIVYENSGEKTYTEINLASVTRNNNPDKFKSDRNESNLRVRIGDPNITVTGEQTYIITYSIKGILRDFEEYDELYWNVTGNEWLTGITKASAVVRLPVEGIIKAACYTGYSGSKDECSSSVGDAKNANFLVSRSLSPNEGMSIVVGYKKGIVPILTVLAPEKYPFLKLQYLYTFLGTLAAGVVLVMIYWHLDGRDVWSAVPLSLTSNGKVGKKPLFRKDLITVEFEPPERLRPAEIGVLIDEKADTLDITASIIDLASRGYLKIEEIEKSWIFGKQDYILHRSQKESKELMQYEKILLSSLFSGGGTSVALSDLKDTFYDDLKRVKDALYEEVFSKGFFPEHPEEKRGKYLLISIIIGAVSFVLTMNLMSHFYIMSILLGVVASSIVLLFFSRSMARRSIIGSDLYRRALGYRLFISGAEKYRQQFFEKKNMFNDILPYTIVFGLTEKYAKAMKEMGIVSSNPTWYTGLHAFSYATFASDMSSFSSSLSSSISSTPSSSGFSGGSSGGGFGGGGGGSW